MQKLKKFIKAHLLIVASVATMAFPVAVPVTVYADSNTINEGVCAGTELQFTDNPNTSSSQCQDSTNATRSINNLVTTIINIFSVIVGIISVIMIVYGGFRYITSGGDQAKVASAKNTILYAVVGLVVVALAQVLVRYVFAKANQARGIGGSNISAPTP